MAKRVALKIQIGLYIAIIINLLIYHHCTKNGKTKLIFKETLRNKLQRKTKCNNFTYISPYSNFLAVFRYFFRNQHNCRYVRLRQPSCHNKSRFTA